MIRFALFLPVALFVALSVVLLLGLVGDPTELPSALVGEPFPAFNLEALDPEQGFIDKQQLIGEVALVNVWATWCYACRIEHAKLNQLAESGVKIIGLNYKDSNSKASAWLEKHGNPYLFSIYDPRGDLAFDLGVTGAPESYLIVNNQVIGHIQGEMNQRKWDTIFLPLIQKAKKGS